MIVAVGEHARNVRALLVMRMPLAAQSASIFRRSEMAFSGAVTFARSVFTFGRCHIPTA